MAAAIKQGQMSGQDAPKHQLVFIQYMVMQTVVFPDVNCKMTAPARVFPSHSMVKSPIPPFLRFPVPSRYLRLDVIAKGPAQSPMRDN